MESCHRLVTKSCAPGTREYYGRMLNLLDADTDTLERLLVRAIKEKDYEMMQRIFFTESKNELCWFLDSGYDHCFLFQRAVCLTACCDYEDIFRMLPEELPLAANGHPMLVNGTALLQCILYRGRYDEEKVVEKAEKYISSKQPKWDRAFAACILAIMKNDGAMLSGSLQTLCENYARTDISKYEKLQCQPAYGVIMIAKHNMTDEEFGKITMPEYKNFDAGYTRWAPEGGFSKEPVYRFEKPFEVFNRIYEMPVAVTKVHRPYYECDGRQVSSVQRKAYFMDIDSMNGQILDEITGKT